jgi:Cu(I)/Ag(I) efflux system protein CusF
MKTKTRFSPILALVLVLALASGSATAQSTHSATGVVKKVDAAKSTVTLAHDPIKSLNWPAMTMDFRVRDKASLAKLKPDQKIQFELMQQGKDYVITSVK